jgi:hypothetical protein
MVQCIHMETTNKKYLMGVDRKIVRGGNEDCVHIYKVTPSREKKCLKCPLVVKEL